MRNYLKIHLKTPLIGMLLISALFMTDSCDEIDPVLHDVASQEQTIVQYILDEGNAEKYSLFGEIINRAELINLLSVRGPYTLFLPDNSAVTDYLEAIGLDSVAEASPERLKELVFNHLTDLDIESTEMGLGALIRVNALGDYLSSEFEGSDIFINKESIITDRDIIAANGVIHAIDKVIRPVHEDVLSVIESMEGYSIFTEALKRSGLSDTLTMIDFQYGDFTARTRYTVYSVSDEVYNNEGISNIEELISRFTEDPVTISDPDNDFFKYVEYHLISGTWFLNHLEKNDYPNINNENFITITLDNDYEINKHGDTYTSLNISDSNIPAKNGVIHSVNDLLPAKDPTPWRVVFDITDYIDFRESDFYKMRETLGPSEAIFQKFVDGENTFEYIKWTGDYLQYYYRPTDWKAPDYINGDCLNMSGFWSLEVTVPRIMKGQYQINAFTRSGPDCLIYIDGELQEHLYKMSEGGDNVIPRYIGTVDWKESTRHTIKLASLNSGLIFWDRLEFTPIQD